MHGLVFFLLQRFVENSFGPDSWPQLFEEAGLPSKRYSPASSQPDEELMQLVMAASRIAQRPASDVLVSFGQFIAPELLALQAEQINKEWKTLDVIVNTEKVMHKLVRANNPGAEPPVLRAQFVADNEVQLVYASARKLCSLAKGIVRGLAQHFRENIVIEEEACMCDGDPFCCFHFKKTDVKKAEDAVEIVLPETVGPTFLGNLSDALKAEAEADSPAAKKNTKKFNPDTRPNDVLQIGSYEILSELGRGGMGIVYLAKDPVLRRHVAIKALLPELASLPVMRDRFVREAQGMATLSHDRIVPVFHVGDEGSIPYIVMPRLIGLDLNMWLEDGNATTIVQALRICIQVASGLQAAHEKQLIHRDIKPSNIWLEAPKGHIKLMDFGLCRAMEDLKRVTVPGILIGTPLYMAPECTEGTADERSDLYSLGAVLYQLLTGQLPFDAKTPVAIITKILTKIPESPRQLNNEISAELDELVMRSIAKDPEYRFQNAQDFHDTLRTTYNHILVESGIDAAASDEE
jgi:predicted hydrocarbon binding protein